MNDYFIHSDSIEINNSNRFQKTHHQEVRRYQISVQALVNTLREIDKAFSVSKKKVLEPESKIATVLLASRFMLSAKCLFNMVSQGYYYDSWILLRSLQENVFYCLSFIESNGLAKRWIVGQSGKGPKLWEVKKAIKISSKPHVKRAYQFMSDFVHSNMPAIARTIKFEVKSVIHPQEVPEYKEDSVNLFKAFRALNTSMLLVLAEQFKNDLETRILKLASEFALKEQEDLKDED